MKKITIVINGKGGAGKDTICNIVSKYFPTLVVSSISPVKEIARECGWNGEKDAKSRKFLADLKRLLAEYNNFSTKYLLEQHKIFLNDERFEIMFVHIREADQIADFLNKITGEKITLLIRKKNLPIYNNFADDNVEDYEYDYVYENDKSIEKLEDDFMLFFRKIINNVCED